MPGNSFGTIFRLTTFGESHGPALGGVIDGCPAGLKIDEAFIRAELARRRPGQSEITTPRDEKDTVEWLSGIMNGVATGAPIGFIIRNNDQRSSDYDALKDVLRPSHADFTWQSKFGIKDHRGGGRSSARETVSRLAGGAVAKLFLKEYGISIRAFVKSVGSITLESDYDKVDLDQVENNAVRCPDPETAVRMEREIAKARDDGDSVGGIIQCVAFNLPIGLGEPVFDKLPAMLSHAIMSINATKGFEIGSGFAGTQLRGSQHNDRFVKEGEKIVTATNHSGGVQGGISNGMPVWFNVAFKPVSTITKSQQTLDVKGEEVAFSGKGRHDPCVVPRAVPIVESMTALVIADMLLLSRCDRLRN